MTIRNETFRILALVLACFMVTHSARAEEKFIIESSPSISPYTISVEKDGVPAKGIAMEIVVGALKKAGLDYVKPMEDQSWKRVQVNAMETPNSLLFTYLRTKEREPTVKWIAPLFDETTIFYTKKDSPAVSSLDQIKKSYKNIGVMLGVSTESRAKAEWDMAGNVHGSPTEEQNAKMLVADHLDGWLAQKHMAVMAMAGVPEAKDVLKENFVVAKDPLWVVTSLKTPDETVAKLRQAIEDFKKTPEYLKIMDAYSK
ncbi:MAG TPA: transporter substrate-binding domain-containing protein [Telmatospirillum sp.]|nr:transporter substrate-binding domain-containing protein [Telmatospirillum sp.]